ncbi:MAG: MOSC domain-containing protein [Pseudomonadota bacterium]
MNLSELIECFPTPGRLVWIGLRPGRRMPVVEVEAVRVDPAKGLLGDRYSGTSGKRQVTLLQREHLATIESFTGRPVNAQMLRRNLIVEGINLMALKGRKFRVGEAVFEATGLCHPCSRMEETLGEGGWNAMRGHGGLTVRVLTGGIIRVGDSVSLLSDRDDINTDGLLRIHL